VVGYSPAVEIFVYSRAAIETVAPHESPHIVISITSAASDVARVRRSPSCRDVLRLVFADIESPVPDVEMFDRAMADRVWAFFERHRAAVESVLVHCDAGRSRSPAIAAALARAITGDDSEFFRRYEPNRHVYRLMMETRPLSCGGDNQS
jgi:predicted protein tyrosine phosphatase